MRLCYFLFLFLSLSSSVVSAQTIRGSIYGRVLDTAGNGVPGATVVAVHVATSTELRYKTDSLGQYDFPRLLQFGQYRLEAEAPGFQRLIREGINLVIDQRAQVDLVLPVGSVSESVRVSAEAPLLETSNSTPGQLLSSKQIEALPNINRVPFSLILIAPGVTPQGGSDGNPRPGVNSTSNFSVNGSRGVTTEMIIDGLSALVPEGGSGGSGTAGVVYSPTSEATEEVKLLNNTFSAEYGKSGGAVVTLLTKSGSNRFHGSLFEFLRNDKLDANQWFSNATRTGKSVLKQNIFGGAIGGPIWKNHTFFFFDYQGFRQVSSGQPTRSTLPTLEMGAGDFSNLRNPQGQQIMIFDPLTAGPGQPRTPFPDNRIPAARMDPTALKIWSFVPTTRRSSGDPYTNIGNNTYLIPVPYNEDQWDFKVDHQFTENHHTMFRASRWTILRDNVPSLPGSSYEDPNPADTGLWHGPRRSYQYMASHTWTVNPRAIFDFRGGYTRYESIQAWLTGCLPLFNSCQTPFDPAKTGMPSYIGAYSDTQGFPSITMSGYQSLGVANQQYWGPDTIALQTSWTQVMGRHVLKFGFDGRRQHYIRGGGSDRVGQFNFTDAATRRINTVANTSLEGNAFASFLLGTPNTGSISKVSVADVKSDYMAWFLQDEFKVSNRLSLSLGIRYDVSRPMWDKFDQMSFINTTAVNPLNDKINRSLMPAGMRSTIVGGLDFANQGDLKGIHDTMTIDWNNIAPRFGLAYRLTNNTVIRAGFGVLYKTQLGEAVPPPRDSFSITNPMLTSIDGARPTNYLSDPFPDGLLAPARGSQGLLTNVGLGASGIAGTNSSNVPYVTQWNLNIQHQFPGQMLVEVGYTGSAAHQLNRPPIDLNELEPQFVSLGNQLNQQVPNPFYGLAEIPASSALSRPTVALGQLLRPYPQFTQFQMWDYNGANAEYHGATARAEKRFSHGLTLLGTYTFAKVMDDYSGIPDWLGAAPARDRTRYDTRREWATNEEEVKHRAVFSYTYELPIGRGHHFLNTKGVADLIVGGWQISGINTFSTGVPVQVVGGTPYHAFGAGTQRPNSTGISAAKSGPATDRLNQWFDTRQFTNPTPFTLGNVGRTLPDVRTDSIKNWDFSAFKVFQLFSERIKLEYRAQFLNFLNTPVFAAPERNFTSLDFGRVTRTANSARQVQMGLRLAF